MKSRIETIGQGKDREKEGRFQKTKTVKEATKWQIVPNAGHRRLIGS